MEEKIKWMDNSNQDTTAEEFKEQKKELEKVVQPIITKLYQAGGAPPPTTAEDDELKDEL